MKKIFEIKSAKSKAGKPYVLVTTTEGDQIWIPYGQWIASCSANLQSYAGGYITTMFYQVGEVMLSGVECTTANSILESFSATQNPIVIAMVEKQYVDAKAEEMNTLALIQRKKRLATANTAPPAQVNTEQPAVVLNNTEEVVAPVIEDVNTDVNEPAPATEEVETPAED